MNIVSLVDDRFIDDIMETEHSCFAIPWSKNMFLEEFSKPIAYYIGVEHEGKLIAYGGFWKVLDEGHITNIAVTERFRRQGVGKRIIEKIISLCKDLDIHSVTLEVRESNMPAIALYKSMGFVRAGKRKEYYENNREDAVIMWKQLHFPCK